MPKKKTAPENVNLARKVKFRCKLKLEEAVCPKIMYIKRGYKMKDDIY